MVRIALFGFFAMTVESAQIDAIRPVPEIKIDDQDGSITLRNVQLIGSGPLTFKADAINGLHHDWVQPTFEVSCDGRQISDSKQTDRTFRIIGFCDWKVGAICPLSKSLDVEPFAIETCRIRVAGGIRNSTGEDYQIETERVREEVSKRKAVDDLREKQELLKQRQEAAKEKRRLQQENIKAAEVKAKKDANEAATRARLRAVCLEVYKNTIDKKLRDLTVREEQQVRSCQVLGIYRPD